MPEFHHSLFAGRLDRLRKFADLMPPTDRTAEIIHGSAAMLVVDTFSGSRERTAWWAIRRCFRNYLVHVHSWLYFTRFRWTGADPEGIFGPDDEGEAAA